MSNPDTALPADIAAAIDALEDWHDDALRGYGGGDYGAVKAALDAAILAHLTAAEAEDDAAEALIRGLKAMVARLEAEIAGLRGSHECVEQHLEDVCTENERLREAAEAVLAYVDGLRFADDVEPVQCYRDLRAALADNAAE